MTCPKCGKNTSGTANFCEFCGTAIPQQETAAVSSTAPQKRENFLAGFVGALIGAALGGGSIILLSQLGYIASISGLILAICTLKGYELLGGKLSTKGIIVCILLVLVTPYIADRIDWAIVIINSFPEENITLGQAFAVVHEIIAEADMAGEYWKNLIMIYGFAALGAFSTLRGVTKK